MVILQGLAHPELNLQPSMTASQVMLPFGSLDPPLFGKLTGVFIQNLGTPTLAKHTSLTLPHTPWSKALLKPKPSAFSSLCLHL